MEIFGNYTGDTGFQPSIRHKTPENTDGFTDLMQSETDRNVKTSVEKSCYCWEQHQERRAWAPESEPRLKLVF